MSIRDEPPTIPLCPECVSNEAAAPATEDEARWGWRWYCQLDSTYYVGTVEEFTAYQRRKQERTTERVELGEAHRAGQNQGVLPEVES